jgi:microcystin-dependent protein
VSEPFLGEIRMFAGNFAPRGWALCDGQLLAVSQNDALFSLLGTIYGGDGRTTFGLPDLRGRFPIHAGQGAGLSDRRLGSAGGSETVVVTTGQLPAHTHAMGASSLTGTSSSPAAAVPAAVALDAHYADPPTVAGNELNATAVDLTGGGQGHPNIQPFQCVNFIIALVGIYPSRA